MANDLLYWDIWRWVCTNLVCEKTRLRTLETTWYDPRCVVVGLRRLKRISLWAENILVCVKSARYDIPLKEKFDGVVVAVLIFENATVRPD